VRRRAVEHVDPEAVEPGASPGEIEERLLREPRDMGVQQADEVGKGRLAQGQIV
jgi:hypothetical protein